MKERWPSGLRRTLGKRVCVDSVPRVRIPLSPPECSDILRVIFSYILEIFKERRRSYVWFFQENY